MRPYWDALMTLERGRPVSGGMVPMPRPFHPRDIREEGQRLGYEGEDLDEFFAIIAACDDHRLEMLMKQLDTDMRRQLRDTQRR